MFSSSTEETKKIAADLALTLKGGEFISLVGDLGAGKTTFAQGLVAGLGSTARVKSPTFAVMNEYTVDSHPRIRRVVHIDFYRFTSEAELGALELEEYKNPETVILAEWPDMVEGHHFHPDIEVRFVVNNDGREMTFDYGNARGERGTKS